MKKEAERPPSFFKLSGGGLKKILELYGPWALVTGASSGIGECFARELASLGFGVALSAQRKERLDALAGELTDKFGVPSRVVAGDLSKESSCKEIADRLSDLEIGLLVNNAGFGAMGRFIDHDPEMLARMVRLNCVAPVLLTSHFAKKMKARRRGGVIIVASVAGYQPCPMMACYGATKGFDLLFGEAIAEELGGCGLDVLVVSPGATVSEFQTVAGALPHSGDSARSVAIEALGALGRRRVVVTGLAHKLQAQAYRFFPRTLVTKATALVLKGLTPPEKR